MRWLMKAQDSPKPAPATPAANTTAEGGIAHGESASNTPSSGRGDARIR